VSPSPAAEDAVDASLVSAGWVRTLYSSAQAGAAKQSGATPAVVAARSLVALADACFTADLKNKPRKDARMRTTLVGALVACIAALAAVGTVSAEDPHPVAPGDTLSRIAARELGSPSRWPEIYALNRGRIANPNMIYVGQLLDLPGGATAAPAQQTSAQPASTSTPPRQQSGGVVAQFDAGWFAGGGSAAMLAKAHSVVTCESTWNVYAVSLNGRYRGLGQWDSTWYSFGGGDIWSAWQQGHNMAVRVNQEGWRAWTCA